MATASTDTFLSFKDASINFTDAVAKLLKNIAQCAYPWEVDDLWADLDHRYVDLERVDSADVPCYLRAQAAVDEAWKKSFELGVLSIELAQGIFSFVSEIDKTSAEAIQPRFHSVTLAIELTRTKCAELQPAITAAWEARRSLLLSRESTNHYVFVHMSMNRIDEYFGPIEDGKVPSLESRATKLAQLWSSLEPTEIEMTASISDVVALNQQHIIRVCMYGLPLRPHYESVSSATLESPLISQILGECLLGKELPIRILARYSKQFNLWKSDALTRLFNKDIIDSLSYLQSHDFSGLPEEASTSLTQLMQLFARTFTSLFSAFASNWAIEQHVHQINALDIFPLGRDSLATLQTIPIHLERVRGVATNGPADVDNIIRKLEQLLQSRAFASCHASTNSGDDPKCIECELADLLVYSKEVLSYNTRLFMWEQNISRQMSEEKENITVNDFRDIIVCDRPYAPSLYPQHFVDPDAQLTTTSQNSLGAPIDPAFNLENLRLFWPQLLAITTHLQKYLPLKEKFKVGHLPAQAPPEPLYHWRPCSCKEQSKFAAESKKAKALFKTASPQPSGLFSRKAPPSAPLTQGVSPAQKKRVNGSLQGDWTF